MHAAAGLAASEADSVALGIIYCLLCEYSSFSCNFLLYSMMCRWYPLSLQENMHNVHSDAGQRVPSASSSPT